MTQHRFSHLFLLLVLALGVSGIAQAAIEVFQFDTPGHEQRFRKLTEELRCLVCQNQNLADSNADLAQDLRHQVYKMVKADKTDAEIINYMVDRYGDFVLYRPPVQSNTVLLWAGPFVLMVFALGALLLVIRRRHATAARTDLSAEEQARLRQLLEEGGSGNRS